MVLSFNKLNKFLKSKGFICKNYYVIDSACIYIEIFNINTADSIMLYIPSKYEIKIDNEVNNVYNCLLYTSPSPRDRQKSRMPSSA